VHSHTSPIERCAECRFDATAYTDDDVAAVIFCATELWRRALWNADLSLVNLRPEPTMWSITELIRATTNCTRKATAHMSTALAAPDNLVHCTSIEHVPTENDPVDIFDLEAELAELQSETTALFSLWKSLDEATRTRHLLVTNEDASLGTVARHVVHQITHHLSDAARTLEFFGAGVPAQRGVVEHIHVSEGGVPKLAVETASVGYRGLAGDRQADRLHHGRVIQAVSLWSTEVIAKLVGEGHSLIPGAAGENLTISGIDWAALRPGVRLRIGARGPLLELTDWADPCSKLAPLFVDRDFNRIAPATDPAVVRYYAKVLRDGSINVGDPIETV
jgi:MOSC domain-containing protein YiiM